MTLLEALKVAQEACDETRREKCHNQVDMTCQCSECVTLREAAAVLARLEAELPKIGRLSLEAIGVHAKEGQAILATETDALRALRSEIASVPPSNCAGYVGRWMSALDAILKERE